MNLLDWMRTNYNDARNNIPEWVRIVASHQLNTEFTLDEIGQAFFVVMKEHETRPAEALKERELKDGPETARERRAREAA